jgi:hypothetical protein
MVMLSSSSRARGWDWVERLNWTYGSSDPLCSTSSITE